jgi:hypothetical protein
VAQLCCPEADRLVSWNKASPATAAADSVFAAGAEVPASPLLPPPPQADKVAAASATHAGPTHPWKFFDFIRP